MPRDLNDLANFLQGFVESGSTVSMLRQAHARKMMIELGTSQNEWPNFAERLDESLHFGANELISGGLELLKAEVRAEQAKAFLFAGAEALEFLVSSTSTYRDSLPDGMLKCAAAYYLSGHHARAYVILQRHLDLNEGQGQLEKIVGQLLQQNLLQTLNSVLGILSDSSYNDASIALGLQDNELGLEEAIERIALHSAAKSILNYLEYLRSGDSTHLAEARERIQNVVFLALEARFVDIWWWCVVIQLLFDELESTSLWANLTPLMDPDRDHSIIRNYIVGALQRNICTLWPSQITALTKITEEARSSFCVRMPTSAGKTRIAELAILTTFQDFAGQNPKCIYIAPFRSLAVEVERTLRSAFGPLGFGVSELYGGYEFSDSEHEVFKAVSILVVTPEKLDAMLRFAPDIFENVKCVIVDEGHTAGDTSERGLRAEIVLNRLLRRLPRANCRYVFASAVLPNAEDFATWIGGNDQSLVASDWRPSRQMVGELRWREGSPTRIVYTHAGHKPFETECFVPRFIEQVPGVGRRRRPFPAEPREAVALSAIRLATQGTVLLFVPQRQHVESTGRSVLETIALETQHNPERSVAHLTVDADRPEVATCLETIVRQLGPDSVIEQCLRKGIAVHHGQLPWQVRQAIEKFIGGGHAQIIVATTTLSAGVNLPIRSVLVKGLWQGNGDQVDALTFWNICGRAGRGMQEIEGQILFFMDLDRQNWQIVRDRAYNISLVERPNAQSIMGVLYQLLRALKQRWSQQLPEVSFEAICERLANNDFSWLEEEDAEGMSAWFRLLDDQLFALLSENLEEGELADTLEAVLTDSLLSVQLASKPIEGIDIAAASQAISARMTYVRTRIPDRVQRDRFYKLGLPIEDCLQLHNSIENLSELLQAFSTWEEMTLDEKGELIRRFVLWAASLPFTQIAQERVEVLTDLIVRYMSGTPLPELSESEDISAIWSSPQELSAEIESTCGFRLSWLANAVVSYVKAAGEPVVPELAAALPAMFKYGTMSPLATVFAPLLDHDSRIAEALAEICPRPYGGPGAFNWFRGTSVEFLVEQGMDQNLAEHIIQARSRILRQQAIDADDEVLFCQLEVLHLSQPLASHPIVNAIAKESADGTYLELLHPNGEILGRFRPIDCEILNDWFNWVQISLSLEVYEGSPSLYWRKVG